MTFIEYTSRAEQAQRLARAVVVQLSHTIVAKGRATLAVPGGTTPGPFLEALATEKLDWSAVTVLPTDERVVPEEHDRSNAKLIRQALIRDEANSATYLSLTPTSEQETPDAAALRLSREVAEVAPVDVAVLGMGGDMHTASLFPGADRLADALAPDAPPVLALTAPGAPEPRLTLTAPIFQTASHLHVLITGPDKKTALSAAQASTLQTAPVRVILDAPGGANVHYCAT
jgi:6-phosphogluconolactonase